MERYTFVSDGYPAVKSDVCYEDQNEDYCGDAIDRLAAYEDTGLEPQTISEILDSVSEWYDAHKEGRLLVLPCKVGDIVWAFWDVPTSFRYVIYCAEVKEFRLREKHFGIDISVLLEPVDFRGRRKEYGEDDFGKTVFRTRKEAETKLKECEAT